MSAKADSRRRKQAFLTAALGSLLLFGAWAWLLHGFTHADPDRFYHLSIARMTVEHGLVRQLPQAEDIGWGRFFGEKEFLFHAITALGNKLGGDGGAIAACALLGAAALGALFFAAANALGPGWGALVVVALTGLVPSFAIRMVLLRPHVLAVAAFFFVVIGLLERRAWLVFLAGLVFTLGYHAGYVPALMLGWALVLALVARPAELKLVASAGAGLLGLGAGLLLNPYFPNNLIMARTSLEIALHGLTGANPVLAYGNEVQPLSAREFVVAFGFPCLVALAAIALVGARAWRKRKSRAREAGAGAAVLLSLPTAVLWIAALISPRAIEYAVPLTALAAAHALESLGPPRRRQLVLGVAVLALVTQLPLWYLALRHGSSDYVDQSVAYFAAIDHIPKTKGLKVFNCEWDAAPYLLYRREDLRFIDFSDPTLLAEASPFKSALRASLVAGRELDPFGVVRVVFRSDYVLCRPTPLTRELDHDPHFRRLYPAAESDMSVPRVYEVAWIRDPAYVLNFSARSEDAGEGLKPKEASWNVLNQKSSSFINLWNWMSQSLGQGECALLQPLEDELARHVGATRLEVAASQGLRVWRNGKLLLERPAPEPGEPWRAREVRLSSPLTARDRLEIQVCKPPSRGDLFGLTLALRKP